MATLNDLVAQVDNPALRERLDAEVRRVGRPNRAQARCPRLWFVVKKRA